jgi:hypothetical protein
MTTASAMAQPQSGPMTIINTNHPPLRRAVYVHVANLTSPYNIDQARLEEELARVRQESEKTEDSSPGLGVDVDTSFSQKRLQPPRGGYNLCL